MEQNAGNEGTLITIDAAKTRISIELTKVGMLIQTIQNTANDLVVDEDEENLKKVSEFLQAIKKAENVIDATHTEIKKPYFEAGKACDKAKNELLAMLTQISTPIKEKYTAVNNEIDRKKQELAAKKERENTIKAGVEGNVLDFATRIAGCKTKKALTDVESLINLEKSPSRATKYGEWHEFAINRYNEALLPIIKDQKIKVEEFDKLEAQLAKENDPEKADEIKSQLENKENEIIQNQVKVQENALNQQSMPISNEAEEILPDITKAGSNMVCEIVDLKTVFKKQLGLLKIELKLVDAKKLGATLRDAGAFKGLDELVFDGIKFKIDKRWK